MIVLIAYEMPQENWDRHWKRDMHPEDTLQAIVDGCEGGYYDWVKVISLENDGELEAVAEFVTGLAVAKMPKEDDDD